MSYDPTDINAREREAQDAASSKRVEREQLAEDIRWLMKDPRGRRLVRRLFSISGMGEDCFTGNSTTFYRQGKQAVGGELEKLIKAHALEHYCTMLREQQGNE